MSLAPRSPGSADSAPIIRQRAASGGLGVGVDGELVRVNAVEEIQAERGKITVAGYTDVVPGFLHAGLSGLEIGTSSRGSAWASAGGGRRAGCCRSSSTANSELKLGKMRTPSAILALSMLSCASLKSRWRCWRSICALTTSACATSPPSSCLRVMSRNRWAS